MREEEKKLNESGLLQNAITALVFIMDRFLTETLHTANSFPHSL